MSAQTPEVRSTEQLREKWLKPEVITGSEILLRSLLLEGVECGFGYPGGAVLYIYDAMYG
ncbi:acetolactate synthase large subunit, partial [Clostridium perfringens]